MNQYALPSMGENVESIAVEGGERFVGDALEIMPLLDRFYDLILTDPPYAIPMTHYHATRHPRRRWSDTSIVRHWFAEVVSKMVPLLGERGHIAVFCDTVSSAVFAPALYEPLPILSSFIWDKGVIGMGNPIRKQHEIILVASRSRSYRRSTPAVRSILRAPKVRHETKRHPAQKPTDLLAEIIDSLCPPEGRVLDPFAGSGSTLCAARSVGRLCDLIELDPSDSDE